MCIIYVLMLKEPKSADKHVTQLLVTGFTLWLLASNIASERLLRRYTFSAVLSSQGPYHFPSSPSVRAETCPWMGVDSFRLLSMERLVTEVSGRVRLRRVAHNVYLQNSAELGTVGFGLLVSYLTCTFSRTLSKARNSPFFISVCAAFVAILTVRATLGTLNYKYFWLVQMLSGIIIYPHKSLSLNHPQMGKSSAMMVNVPKHDKSG